MPKCGIKKGDKVVHTKKNGLKVSGTVVRVHGNGFINVNVTQPKLGVWRDTPIGIWTKVCCQKRCKVPPKNKSNK
jgi:hypothetical protein